MRRPAAANGIPVEKGCRADGWTIEKYYKDEYVAEV